MNEDEFSSLKDSSLDNLSQSAKNNKQKTIFNHNEGRGSFNVTVAQNLDGERLQRSSSESAIRDISDSMIQDSHQNQGHN